VPAEGAGHCGYPRATSVKLHATNPRAVREARARHAELERAARHEARHARTRSTLSSSEGTPPVPSFHKLEVTIAEHDVALIACTEDTVHQLYALLQQLTLEHGHTYLTQAHHGALTLPIVDASTMVMLGYVELAQ
jgi:hypothetical protein